MSQATLKWIDTIPSNIGWYISGFVDGEGSFVITLRKRKDYVGKWQVNLIFNVAQRDISNLIMIKKYLGIGRLQARKDGVHYYIVTNPDDIRNKLIPFFEQYHFFSESKQKNFKIFKAVAQIVDGKHLVNGGLLKVIILREKINEGKGRKRKYSLQDYLNSQESSETIRQTPLIGEMI
ncbi:MAG: LAGLIDADG family homing endonuclease [Nanoarchaeota archaeon]|nr:LAGLIDADG family homing endonuclease [Nanoarchaeota archaeon]